MGIEKIRRRLVGKGGMDSLAVGSFGTVNVNSVVKTFNAAITGVASLAAATLTAISGDGAWRGITTVLSGLATATISATAATSGFPIMVSLGATSVTSHRDLVVSVDSIVDGVSFSAVTNLATVDDQEVVYTIIGG